MHTKPTTMQGGAMQKAHRFPPFSFFSLVRRVVGKKNGLLAWLLSAALLFAASACAQEPKTPANAATESTRKVDAATILRPYLGKWRPTSYSKGLYMVSITITETGLSIETGGSVMYEFVKKTDEGVIVRVIDRHATNPHLGLTHSHTTAFGFSLEMQTLDSFPPGGPSKTRELLLICHGSGDIDSAVKRLISEMKTKRCPDVYIR